MAKKRNKGLEHWILDDKGRPVQVDLLTWAKWFGTVERIEKVRATAVHYRVDSGRYESVNFHLMRNSDKKKKTSIAISERTLVKLKRRAKLETRSLSNFLEWCFNRILEEEPERRRRRNRVVRRILKGLIFAASSGLIAFSPAQMPRSQCKHFCLPPENPMWEVMPQS